MITFKKISIIYPAASEGLIDRILVLKDKRETELRDMVNEKDVQIDLIKYGSERDYK